MQQRLRGAQYGLFPALIKLFTNNEAGVVKSKMLTLVSSFLLQLQYLILLAAEHLLSLNLFHDFLAVHLLPAFKHRMQPQQTTFRQDPTAQLTRIHLLRDESSILITLLSLPYEALDHSDYHDRTFTH